MAEQDTETMAHTLMALRLVTQIAVTVLVLLPLRIVVAGVMGAIESVYWSAEDVRYLIEYRNER